MTTNPLRSAGDRRLPRVPDPCALVVFGVTGDLARKKLIPAVYDLANRGLLPPGFVLLGFARRDWGDGDFEELAKEAAKKGARTEFRESTWDRLSDAIKFLPGSFDDDAAFDNLAQTLHDLDASHGTQGNAAFYLSIPPAAFPTVLRQMHRTGMADNDRAGAWRRVVVEKPFGHDLPSSRELNTLVDDVFTARDVFRIDHYLGKETVQNLLALRFANALFEPIWNSNHVDSVQITMAEDVGIGGRAGFYEETGAGRDVLQNHLLQLLALTAMEEPVGFDAESLRTEKRKVLGALKPPTDLVKHAVRGQYDQGWLAGERVKGYRAEDDVAPDSRTETFAAVRLEIETRRWANVPFYLRTGKRLPRRVTEIAVDLQEGAAPALRQDGHRRARREPARRAGAARRGRDLAVRVQGARQHDGGPRRRDGLPVRRGLHRGLPRGLRAAAARRAAGRRLAVPPQRGGGAELAGHRPDRGLLGRAERGRARARALPSRRMGPQGRRRDAGPRGPRLEETMTDSRRRQEGRP